MKKYFGLLVVLSLMFVTSVRAEDDDAVFCTMDAKQCPDGSFVGRGGPNCEFTPCGGTPPAEPTDRKTCTEEAKQCPDGSYVGRGGPNCEFTPCGISEEKREEMKERVESYRVDMEKKREEFKNKMETRREAFMREVAAKKEAFRSADSETKVGFCRAAENMLGERFNSAVKNLEKFTERIANVLEKLKEGGADTAVAETALDASEAKLAEAKDKLEDIRTLVPASCEAVTAENFEQIKLSAREAKEILQEVRLSLQEVVSAIKDLKE